MSLLALLSKIGLQIPPRRTGIVFLQAKKGQVYLALLELVLKNFPTTFGYSLSVCNKGTALRLSLIHI